MKKIILIFFFISKNFVFAQNIEDVRSMYFTSIDNISKCTSLKVLLNSFEKKDNTINAYIGANALLYCKFSNDVFEKFITFAHKSLFFQFFIFNSTSSEISTCFAFEVELS